MKQLLLSLILLTSAGLAPASESAAEIKKDIERHRAMSAAHLAAAKCLESGSKPDTCVKELTTACKGLAIGKYCGMRHQH